MDTREIAKEYRLSHWARIMQERCTRGISIKAYCQESGMHENVYYYYYNIVEGRARQPAVALFQFIA